MENTIENFKKFASQYWGLSIMSNDDYIWRSEDTLETVLQICNGDLSKWYLNLTPLSQITDEDLEEIFSDSIMNPYSKLFDVKVGTKFSNLFLSDITTVDFLRSKGYALPYMGLSVEQQIEYGWVKLKTNQS